MDTKFQETTAPQAATAGPDCAESTGSGYWTPVCESMPKTGKKVLVCGHWNNGNRWRTIAEWWPAGTLDASNWDDPPEEWWDEDGNECRCPDDGWWESQVEAETMWGLSNITHWQPLPSFPNTEMTNAEGRSP